MVTRTLLLRFDQNDERRAPRANPNGARRALAGSCVCWVRAVGVVWRTEKNLLCRRGRGRRHKRFFSSCVAFGHAVCVCVLRRGRRLAPNKNIIYFIVFCRMS